MNKKYYYRVCIFLLLQLLYSCGSGSSIKLWNDGDLKAPELISVKVLSSNTIVMEFNENIKKNSIELNISDGITADSIQINKHTLTVTIQQDLFPGDLYTLTIKASDVMDNYVILIESIYGYNARLPTLVINEFLCEGSKKYPDKVELFVLKDGNLAGLALQEGGISFSKRVILPNIEVIKGDYIIVHWVAEPQENIISEQTSKTESLHPQAYKTAWDFFSKEGKGISNTNGSLSLIDLNNNTILDAVIYSVKENDSSHKYRGFSTSKAFTWAEEIYKNNAWNISAAGTEQKITPSDTVNPKDSTTTRSIGRNFLSEDTNSASDWHIADGGKSSFGEENTQEYYK